MPKTIFVITHVEGGDTWVAGEAFTDETKGEKAAEEWYCGSSEEVKLEGNFKLEELIAQFKCSECGATHEEPMNEVTTLHPGYCNVCSYVTNRLKLHKIIIA